MNKTIVSKLRNSNNKLHKTMSKLKQKYRKL